MSNIKPTVSPVELTKTRTGRKIYTAANYRTDYKVVMGLALAVIVTALWLAVVL